MKHIPRDRLRQLMSRGEEQPVDVPPSPEQPQSELTSSIAWPYELMERTSTYALGVEALRQSYARDECPAHPMYTKGDGNTIVRPLRFQENIRARVEDYETTHNLDGSVRSMEERLKLLTERWLDSCTGITYKAGTSKFKIIPVSSSLIEIDSSFNSAFMPVNYDSISVDELDKARGKYNELLTKTEVLEHPAWQAAVEDDRLLLTAYSDIVFTQLREKYNRDTGMRFWVRDTRQEDELRALFVDYLDSNSYADGYNNLISGGSFLRVAHPERRRRVARE